MKLEDIKKLATLARVEMDDKELEGIAKDFDSILAYVDQIREVSDSSLDNTYPIVNVMREDIVTNKSGEYKDKLIAEMPDSQDGFLKVKQIL